MYIIKICYNSYLRVETIPFFRVSIVPNALLATKFESLVDLLIFSRALNLEGLEVYELSFDLFDVNAFINPGLSPVGSLKDLQR